MVAPAGAAGNRGDDGVQAFCPRAALSPCCLSSCHPPWRSALPAEEGRPEVQASQPLGLRPVSLRIRIRVPIPL